MIRGIERRNILRDAWDRRDLIDRLSLLLPETRTACYAWSFMPNHAHFLMRSGPSGIADLMRRLPTGYVVSFNRRHRRTGQLFQNRYKSIICDEDVYSGSLSAASTSTRSVPFYQSFSATGTLARSSRRIAFVLHTERQTPQP
jgi:REP element-mobilizing transposase RayT